MYKLLLKVLFLLVLMTFFCHFPIVAQSTYTMSAGTHTITTCSAAVYDNGGPTEVYSSNSDDTLIVYPASTGCKVSLSGTYYTENVSYDYIKIYNGVGTSGTELATLAGNSSVAVPIVSTANNGALTIVFHSDGSVQYDGFEFQVSCVGSCACGGPLGVVATTGDHSVSLSWDALSEVVGYFVECGPHGFTPGNGTQLYTNTSYYDFLNLTNGMEYDFYVWFDCGNDQQITTEIPTMVSAIPGVYVMSAGMHTITACSGTVYDNGGPTGEYTSYSQDTLIIYPATSECKIALEGTYHTESVSFDYIKVFSGAGVSGTLLATLAGNSSLAVPIVSNASNGALTVVFISDGSVQNNGYELRIQCVCNTVRIFDTVCYRGRYQAHGYDTTFYHSGDYELVSLGMDGTLTEVHLHVRPKSDVFVAGAYYFCSQGNIMLTANNAVSYLWSTGATTQSISVNSIGSYQVTITDVHGCTASASHTISPIEDFIQLIDFPDMCAGNSYTITGSHELGSEIVLNQNQSTLSSSDTSFLPDGIPCEPQGCSYRSTLTFTDYSDNARVASVEDIYYVKVNLEHSFIGDIYINITCPNGQKADVLRKGASVENTDCVNYIPESAKDWSVGANSTYADFGQANPNRDTQYPCDRNVSLNAPGTGWNYCWSNNTTQGYVYAADGGFVYRSANIHSSIVDSSDVAAGVQFYHPDESFQSLVGCPLNGDWYIEVVDGYSMDNGYIFGWELALTEELLSSNAFHVSQIVPDDIWTTVVSDSSFTISPPATLQQDTTLQYSLHFYDSGGCSFDTIVPVHVYAQHDVEVWEYACNSYTWNGVTYTSTPAMPLTHTYQTAAGCDSLVTLHLTVGNVEASVSNDGPYCVGDTIHLICEDPQDDVSYSWTGPNGWVSSEVNPIIYPASLEMNGTYTLVKTLNGDYCSAQASTTVQVDQINTSVHVSPSDTICVGDEVILIVDCIAEDSILFSEGFAAILNGDDDSGSGSNQKYQCTLPNFPNCDNEHVFLAGGHLRFGDVHSGGGGYITSRSMDLSQPFTVKMWMRGWNNSNEHPWFYLKVDNDTVLQQYIPVSDFSDPYTEYDYVSLTGATANSTITIGNTDLRQRFFIDSVVVVQNGECQYSWSTGATTNSITVSPSQSTDYYVTVTSAAGCAEVDTFSIVVNLRPVVTFDQCGGTCAIPSMMMDCHDGIVLPPAVPCASNYEFAGWSTTPVNAATSTEPTPLYLAGEQYLASTDITLYAVYKICEMVEEVRYAKVTAAPANWSGEYLIAYHDGGLVFDGSLTALDAVNNNHSVTFNGNYVNNAAALAPYTFTISQGNSNTCTIRSASGYYIGQNTDANGMLSSPTIQHDNTISYNVGDIDIVGSGGAYLRFNSAANQNRFRYYKSATYTGQKAIQLYRKELVEVESDCEWLSYPSCPVSIAVATNSDPNGACDPQAIVPPTFTVTDACFENPTATVTSGGVEGQGCDRSQTWTATYENACGGIATPVSVTYTWKVSPDPVDFSSIICENESVVLFDTVLATSGIYTRTGTSNCGCDSVVTLHLTINHSSTGDTTATACDRFDWYEHANITSSCDNLTHMFTNASGCDSVVTLHLTVNHDTTVVITKDTCDWYQWHNTIYRQSGRYEWHGETAQGCDSTEVLWLTIRKSTYGILNAEVCEDDLPLVLYGQTFTESVMSNAVISNAAGCDSLILINVTVKYNTYSDLYDTIVENSLPYDTLGMHFTETGTQTDTISNVAGCDSIVTFHLQVWPNAPITELDTVVCEGALPLVWHDSLFTVAGQKTVTLHTQHGADSVVTMHLTVNPMYDIQETAIVSQGDLPYVWHGREFSADTTVCDTLHTQAGCDSVVCLDLTVTAYNVEDTAIALCPGETYPWHGQTLSEARSYRDTVPEENTIYIATVTINPTYSVTDPVIVPQGDLPYVWHGRAFSADTTVCDTLRTQAGCDSVVCLDLTVTAYHVEDTAIALCPGETYPWHGQTLSEARSYRDTVPEENTIYIATVTINPTYSVTNPVIVPQGQLPYLWHGRAFSADTTVCDTLHTQAGCDSVVCLDLTVTAYHVEDTTIALCPGETYLWHGQTLSEARSYRDTVPEENTIYIATVTISPTYSVTDPVIIPQGQLPYLWHGREFSADTTVCDTLRTEAGCDSVVCLDLTVTAYNVEDTAIALCPGETYPWHGQTLSEARSYRDTVPEENTIYIATVTINPTYSVTDPVIVPQGDLPYVWHGRAFSADTTVCDTLRTQAGCDSVVCLDLAVTAYNVEDTIIALCPGETYTWHGQTLSEARSYRDTVPEENTIYIATVTINPTYSVTDPVIVPQGDLPYVWHGRAFSADTTVCDTLRTQAGCDSVVCLDLTVTAYNVEDTAIALCPGETYLWHGQTLSEARSYRDTVPEENTIYIATVTINPTYSVTSPVIIPQSQLPYVWHGRAFSADTTVCDTLRTVAGCDSVVCLDLTVTAYNVEDTAIALCPGETYPWHGQILSEARSYRDTVPEENTIYIATVTINPIYSVTDPVIVPQGQLPYVWHGRAFSADTTVCDTLRTQAGCDSVVCIDLTVTAYNVEDTIVALCPGETYTWHGQTLSEARSYRDTVPEENTIYIATVTINPTYSVTDPVIVPQGDLPYLWHGRAFSADTTVCDTLRTQAGCDSVVCLDLTVTAYHVEDTIIALCQGETYPWHGQTLSEARSYRDTVPEENTIYIATVTINPTYSVTSPVIVPQGDLPYVWHGRAFSADTTVCDTLHTQAGCDSVVCLDLAVTAYNVEDTTIALCPDETYPWHGQILSEARSYRDTIPGENTIFIATVTINPTYSVTDPVIIPQGQLPYLWHGREFSADTTVCDTLRTQAGCDSVVCLDLTVTSYNVEYTAITLCQGETYIWHNQILSEARSYRDTVPEENTIYIATVTVNPTYAVETFLAICENQLPYHYVNGQIDTTFDVGTPPLSSQNFQLSTITGCDSIVTLHLTVSSPTVSDIIVSSCGSFVWHGRTFTESTDTATFRTTNAAGCDIILTLHLTVNPLDSTDLYESICAGDTYDFNGRLISQEGIYRDTIHRQEACDSIVILHLSILNPSHQSYTIERCGSYTWENGDGQTYTESGQYYYRHENSDGCMQVDTLFLTIHPLPATPILSITPNTGCTEYNGIITVTAPVGGYLYDFDGGGFQSSNTFANLNAGEYIVSVRDVSHGCVSTTTALVTTVGNTLAVEVSGTSPCEGEDMQLFAETQSGGVTYLWSGPDNFTSTLQNPIVGNASPANAGVYTVLVTEMATGCVASGSLTVAVNPLPVVTVSGDAMIMIGHSATLTAMGADSYLWSNGAATPVVTVSPQEMTTYTVTGTNTFGCNDTASFEVVVIYDCFLPAQNGEEYVHCVSQVVPPQLPEVIACGDTIPLVAGENMGNVESGCGDSVFVYHYTFRDTQYTWTYTYHVSPDAMPLLNNRSIIISCLSDTVKPTPPVMVNSCLDTIVPIEMPVEVDVTGCSGVVRYVWKYEDCAGHQQNWTFSYIIRDNIAPTFSQPGDVAICRNANGTYDADTTITGLPVSLNDNCADTDDLSVSYNDLFVDNQNMADTLFRTWVVTDPCGNAARAVQKIIVYDTYHTEIHEGICGRDLPYTFNVGGRDTIISAVSSYSSTFNFPLISQNGCDSLVTLYLTVDTVAEIQEQLSICENELPYHFTYGQIDTIFDEGTPAFATYRFLIPPQGGCESIVWLALTVTPSYNVDIYETACDMYIWHNTPYRQSGSYEWHGQTVNGCDSVETLRLTIHRSSMSVQDSTVCDNDLPFVWNGVTFYEAGNGSAVLAGANAEHCDSVVLMMLHVNRTDTTVLYDTIVENQLPYYYTNGEIDTTFAAGTAQSSTFRFLLQNVSGCDSTVTLYLTMNMNVTAQADSTVCENDLPLQWNGITFTGAGTDSVVLAASNGADSLLVMHVYVNPNTSAALYDTIVENQLPYHYTNGQIDTVFAVGTPHFTTSRFMLSNANGCDSAVTLKLTVILNVSVELDSAVCPSALPLIWNGVEFSDAGTDTAVVPASTGSDSVIVMHLTLLPVQLTNLHVEVCASDFPYHFVNGQIDTVIASLATHHAVFNFLFSTQDGCDSIVRLNLSVLDTSLSVVSLSDYCDNMSTTLSALSSMENFVWSTGEISQDIEVTAPGVYSVTASTGDCQSMSSYVVDACELVLYLPNAISPGKLDGHNDCFSLPERYIGLIDEFEITIVNRWGEVVFHSNDKNFKWYGDYKGSVVRQNVYNYIIHYTELDPKKGRHHLKGALIVL